MSSRRKFGKENVKMQDNYNNPVEDNNDALYPENVNNDLQGDRDGTEESVSDNSCIDEPSINSKDKATKSETEEAQTEIDYSVIAAEDLSEIKKLFPEFSELRDIRELTNATRFAELRDAGLSVSEALAATNMDRMISSLAKRIARQDTKSHLRSAVPSASALQKNRMSAEELHSARELFGSLSDRELENLYKRATS